MEERMAQPREDDFYTIHEAARTLRVSVSTVWRWIDAGKLAAYRVGQRRVRIKKADLATMVKPFREGRVKMAKSKEPIETFKMSPSEAADQLTVIQKARYLQEQILASRCGVPLPPCWQDINEAREQRGAQLGARTPASMPVSPPSGCCLRRQASRRLPSTRIASVPR